MFKIGFPFGKKKLRMEDIFDPKKKGKYPNRPIYREVVFKPSEKSCPKCSSHFIRPAGYGNRLECQDCGHVFS